MGSIAVGKQTLPLTQRHAIAWLVVEEEHRTDINAVISGDGSAAIEPIRCDLAIDNGKVGESRVLAEVVDNEARILLLLHVQRQCVLIPGQIHNWEGSPVGSSYLAKTTGSWDCLTPKPFTSRDNILIDIRISCSNSSSEEILGP